MKKQNNSHGTKLMRAKNPAVLDSSVHKDKNHYKINTLNNDNQKEEHQERGSHTQSVQDVTPHSSNFIDNVWEELYKSELYNSLHLKSNIKLIDLAIQKSRKKTIESIGKTDYVMNIIRKDEREKTIDEISKEINGKTIIFIQKQVLVKKGDIFIPKKDVQEFNEKLEELKK